VQYINYFPSAKIFIKKRGIILNYSSLPTKQIIISNMKKHSIAIYNLFLIFANII